MVEAYRRQYFETLDTIAQTVRSRFDQPDYKTYQNIEELLLKAVKRMPFNNELSVYVYSMKEILRSMDLKLS